MLDSNLFTRRRISLSWEKPLENTMPPGSILNISIYNLLYFSVFTFCSCIQKYQKYQTILSIRSHSRKWPWRDWQPLIALAARFLFVCAGARDSCVVSYWIDTLVLKNWGKYLRYCAASPFPLRGNTTQAREVARRISGAVAGEAYAKVIYQVPITNPLSFGLHLFASRFPLPHFTLAVLFALLPSCVYRSLASCLLVCCLLACHYG